jgi:hypothetical protein
MWSRSLCIGSILTLNHSTEALDGLGCI